MDKNNREINSSKDFDNLFNEAVFDTEEMVTTVGEESSEEVVDASSKISVENEEIVDSSSENAKESKKQKNYLRVYDVVSTIMSAIVIITVLFLFVFRPVTVDGESMTNTLQHKDWLLTVGKSEYKQGDIVVIVQDTYFHEPLIKRVIAKGGQTVDIDYQTGNVSVDGKVLKEPYKREQFIQQKLDDCEFPYTVPEGYLFCMGDNRNGSTDSRSSLVGPIDERQILGKAVVRVIPFGAFDIYDYE